MHFFIILNIHVCIYKWGFPDGSTVKNLPAVQEMQETQAQSLGQKDPLQEGMPTNFSIRTWKFPWQATVKRVAKNQTGLSNCALTNICVCIFKTIKKCKLQIKPWWHIQSIFHNLFSCTLISFKIHIIINPTICFFVLTLYLWVSTLN